MNRICETCDTKIRLGICEGKEGDFKYCYRKTGSRFGLEETIKPFTELIELHEHLDQSIDRQSLRLTDDYGNDGNMCLLMGKYYADDNEYPLGFITKIKEENND